MSQQILQCSVSSLHFWFWIQILFWYVFALLLFVLSTPLWGPWGLISLCELCPEAHIDTNFLYLTRNCCSPEGYEVESEPDTDDTETDGDADEPDTDDIDYGVWTVEYGEVVGGDDVVAGMIPAEEETDKEDEVARPPDTAR